MLYGSIYNIPEKEGWVYWDSKEAGIGLENLGVIKIFRILNEVMVTWMQTVMKKSTLYTENKCTICKL